MSKEAPTDAGDTNSAAVLSKGGTVLPFRIWQEPEGNPQHRETSWLTPCPPSGLPRWGGQYHRWHK